ncbi:MAG: relaxase [Robiginitomaculum sp.]|nr:relaxase [Robiginitomaculum sp.]
MILVGNQRGGAQDLAVHLMKPENEHVDVHEVRGFATSSLHGAFNEAYALSRGTQCRKFLYSLSVNPPPDKQVFTTDFIRVIDRAEKALGLTGQPRAIVFHEKQGRRHAHCVWSRIDTQNMRAVHMPYDRKSLVDLTRDLFIEHGWDMPDGLIDKNLRDPRNFTLAEWQQAKRQGKDPRAIKTALQDAWAISDSKAAFTQALAERGYWLARGDRRGFVAVDHKQEIYNLPKWLGLKTKHVRSRLGESKDLPSVEETQTLIANAMSKTLGRLSGELSQRNAKTHAAFERRRIALVARQRLQRQTLQERQDKRRIHGNKIRQARFRKGISGIWDRLRGEHRSIQRQNEHEAYGELQQDRKNMDEMVFSHLKERKHIEIFKLRHRNNVFDIQNRLERDRLEYKKFQLSEPEL